MVKKIGGSEEKKAGNQLKPTSAEDINNIVQVNNTVKESFLSFFFGPKPGIYDSKEKKLKQVRK